MRVPKDLNDRHEYPGMVHWFSPIVLLKTVQKVIASTIFAQYADRRLVHAALDSPIDPSELDTRCGGPGGVTGKKDEPIWFDYVADLGDGFDATYSIAYLMAQKTIKVDGQDLPRADCLIMGGDEVYPDASPYDYQKRMKRPYQFAFPLSKKPGADRPKLFVIPGNHDWYDGLTLFLANFCRGRDTSLGSWNATQARSYFAVHLGQNWWIWGYDSQLGEDIDKPQADYFAAVARAMPPDARVIICASVPSWLHAEMNEPNPDKREAYYRGLHYIANIVRTECRNARVPLVLSGDLHHYSRYVADKTNTTFITAGGGGAFLHPTHHLGDTIRFKWVLEEQALNLAKDAVTGQEACYPSRTVSKRLAWGNWKFVWNNPDFCLTLGILYWLSGLVILAWRGYRDFPAGGEFTDRVVVQLGYILPTPATLLIALLFVAAIIHYADIKPKATKLIVGGMHALTHICIVLGAVAFASVLASPLLGGYAGEILYFLAVGGLMLASGFVGGLIWGLYLFAASWIWAMHANDAFSAMRLDSFRHFLRIKISGDTLTIYPVGLDRTPPRSEWRFSGAKSDDQDTPVLVPRNPLGQRFIESPIEVQGREVGELK